MPSKVVIVPTGNEAEEKELRKLLEEMGYEVCPSEVLADEEPVPESDEPAGGRTASSEKPGPVCIVLLPDEGDLDEETNGTLANNAGCGIRSVGVWPRGKAECEPPQAFEDFGGSVVPWDTGRLRAAIDGEEPVWETPEGTPRLQPATPRNKC